MQLSKDKQESTLYKKFFIQKDQISSKFTRAYYALNKS